MTKHLQKSSNDYYIVNHFFLLCIVASLKKSIKPRRHVGGNKGNMQKCDAKVITCAWYFIIVITQSVHNSLQALAHASLRRYFCNLSYLQHGDVNYYRQNDVIVIPCTLGR